MPSKKVVFNTGEIAHLWAHQKVKEARNRQGNFYFNGPTIFSYGSHFPIARLVVRKGKKAVLFTVREFSQMTSQHKYQVRDACRHMTVFKVPSVNATHQEVLAYYRDQCDEGLSYIRTARVGHKAAYVLTGVEADIKMFNRYARFFDLRSALALPKDWKELKAKTHKLSAEQTVREAERTERQRLERIRLAELSRKKFEEILPEWEQGRCPTSHLPNRYDGTIYLRLRKAKGKTRLVETSRGAMVSLDFVRKLWKLIQQARETNKPITKIELGQAEQSATEDRFSYRVDSVGADGTVHAGCHHIQWPQIERFAKQLGWLHESPSKTEPATA